MRIAFYRASYGNWVDAVVDWWTGHRGYSHIELIFSDGTSFSASPRDGGTRFKKIVYKPKRWVFFDLDVSPEQEKMVRAFCKSQVGKPYDFWGALNTIFHLGTMPGHWFCTNVAITALQKVGRLTTLTPDAVHPNGLFCWMSRRYKPTKA